MKRLNENIDPKIPLSALKFLNWFCKYSIVLEIEGDLIERFSKRKNNRSNFINSLFFWIETIGFFRPTFWRNNLFEINFWGIEMFKSNLKFAVRNIYKNFFFSSINISGLAVGIACVLYIFFYIQNEMNYDSFNEKSDRIYRVVVDANFNGNDFKIAESGGKVGPLIQNEFPEVENFTRIDKWGIFFVRYEDKSFKEHNIISADSTFFDVFSVAMIIGDPEKILAPPGSIVISKSTALKYFGNEDPIGKVLHFDEKDTYTVAGIFEDIPVNSHFNADFIVSNSGRKRIDEDYLTNANYYTYLLLKENVNHIDFKNKFNAALQKHVEAEVKNFGIDFNDLKAKGTYWDFNLQKLSDIHFDTIYSQSLNPSIDISYIYIFSAIAVFILFIASINFINLSTAKSTSRAKEVGIKKVVGSYKSNLVIQFLTESIILSIISFLIAVALVELFKPYFFDILGKQFEFTYFNNIGFGIALLSLIIFTGVVAGSFPAFVLSRFTPVAVLKGSLTNVMKKSWFRSTLVVFQFTASIVLIIGTIIVFNQLEYMQNKNLGFDKEHILIIDDAYILGGKSKIFKDEVLNHPDVLNGTVSGYLPINSYRSTNGTFRDGDMHDPKIRPLNWWTVDYNYFETLNIKFFEGRNFSKDFLTDSQAVVINRACLEHAGWEDNPFEHTLGRIEGRDGAIAQYNIIGIVENFNFQSLKNEIEPIIFRLGNHDGYISFKVKDNLNEVINFAEQKWKEFVPNQPFSYQFMDEAFSKEYKSEISLLGLFRVFAVIAVVIGCMGLFGLSAYTAERRTKEIGVRKIMGASVSTLIFQLSKEFTALVIFSFLISSPIAYFLMNGWLEDYAYRVNIEFGTFILAGIIAFLIAVITVSYHAVKVSLINPAKSLRYE